MYLVGAIAIETIPKIVEDAQKNPNWSPKQVVSDAIREANRAIYKLEPPSGEE